MKKKTIIILLISICLLIGAGFFYLYHPHKYNEVYNQSPTCIEDGVIQYACWCGSEYEEYPELLGHDYNEVVSLEATCTENGIRTFTCSICEDTYEEEIVLLGHRYEEEITDAKCGEKGYIRKLCINCEYIEETEIPALEHDYQITEETDREKIYTCQKCNDSYNEEKKVQTIATVKPEDIDPTIGKTGPATSEEMAELYAKIDAMIASGELGIIGEQPVYTPPEGVDINNLPDNQAWTGIKLITVDFDSMMSRSCDDWTSDEKEWCLRHYDRTDLAVIQKLHAHNKVKYEGITLH